MEGETVLYLVSKYLVNNKYLDKNKELYTNLRFTNKINNNYLKKYLYKLYYFCDYHLYLHDELYRKLKFSVGFHREAVLLNKDKKQLSINCELIGLRNHGSLFELINRPYNNFDKYCDTVKFYNWGNGANFKKLRNIKIEKYENSISIKYDNIYYDSIPMDSKFKIKKIIIKDIYNGKITKNF